MAEVFAVSRSTLISEERSIGPESSLESSHRFVADSTRREGFNPRLDELKSASMEIAPQCFIISIPRSSESKI